MNRILRTFAAGLLALAGALALPGAAFAQECSGGRNPNLPTTLYTFQFATGVSKLDAKQNEEAKAIAKRANELFVQQICVFGFADKVGDPEKNKKLSLARAQAVANAIKAAGYGKQVAVQAKGEPFQQLFGSAKPASQADRRVEVIFQR